MAEKTYFRKYQLSPASQSATGEACFLEYLESLNELDWQLLMTDVIREHPDSKRVFLPERGETVTAVFCSFLSRLGSGTLRVIATALERVLHGSDPRLLEPAVFIAGNLPISLTKHTLMKFVMSDRIHHDIREEAARSLANHCEDVPISFWNNVDLRGFPGLAPAVLSALAETSPQLGLEKFLEIPDPPLDIARLEYPTRILLRNLARRPNGMEETRAAYSRAVPWLQTLLKSVSAFPEFAHLPAFDLSASLVRSPLILPMTTDKSPLPQVFAGAGPTPPSFNDNDFLELWAISVTNQASSVLKQPSNPLQPLIQVACRAFASLNGHSRTEFGRVLGSRIAELQLSEQDQSTVWRALMAASKQDQKARREPFLLAYLKEHTYKWIEKQDWKLNDSAVNELLYDMHNVRREARNVVKHVSDRDLRLYFGVSEFHEDRILTALVINAMKNEGFFKSQACARKWGTLDTYEMGEADFGLSNDAQMTTPDRAHYPRIYDFCGYYLFATKSLLAQVYSSGGSAPDSVKRAIEAVMAANEHPQRKRPAPSREDVASLAWVAVSTGVRFAFDELREPMCRAAARVERKKAHPKHSSYVQEEDSVVFDDELEQFVQAASGLDTGTPGVFLGGAIHGRLLNRWWTSFDGAVQLLGPREFQGLAIRNWPPSNRLVCSKSTSEYSKLTSLLGHLYQGIGRALAQASSITTGHSDASHRRLIRHCLSILTNGDLGPRGSKWNFVTHEEDMRRLLREDDNFKDMREQPHGLE